MRSQISSHFIFYASSSTTNYIRLRHSQTNKLNVALHYSTSRRFCVGTWRFFIVKLFEGKSCTQGDLSTNLFDEDCYQVNALCAHHLHIYIRVAIVTALSFGPKQAMANWMKNKQEGSFLVAHLQQKRSNKREHIESRELITKLSTYNHRDLFLLAT